MMQALGRHYVRYFTREHLRSGTLLEGRFKSCLAQTGSYLLTCQRCIELHPFRAAIVKSPAEYVWSSYQCNGLGRASDLCTPHAEYFEPGKNSRCRLQQYRTRFECQIEPTIIEDIRSAVNSGLLIGNWQFKSEMALLTGQRTKAGKPGRTAIVVMK